MELREFISETLKNIIDGIQDAQDYADTTKGTGTIVPQLPAGSGSIEVQFDVAVLAEKSTTAEGKAGISVFSVGASAGAETESMSSTASRIKFPVPVNLPTQGLQRKKKN